MEKEMPVYEVKVSKFEQEVRKAMRKDPEYAKLTEQMEAVQAKQVALDEKYDEIAAQIHEARDEYRAVYDKRFKVECELEEKIRTELMADPEMAKLVDVYEE
jgi:hypothetical protein